MGLEKIYEYNSQLFEDDNDIYLISGGMTQLVDRMYANGFGKAQGQWNSRAAVLEEIIVLESIPSTTQAHEWHDRLLQLHKELRSELMKLLQLLDSA